MGSVLGFLKRNWAIFAPQEVVKSSDAVRIGLLGASDVATMAMIPPAKSHPDLIVAAVAARDKSRAEAYAKKHNIPIVHNSYQDLLDDPAIDAIYVPLPNGLHYEWAMRALKAGKHVLVEKPFTSNAIEARNLVNFHSSLPSSQERPRPVLLEASHHIFHPAFQIFLSLLSSNHIVEAQCEQAIPAGFFGKNNIRFNYDLAGGTLMDFGAYNVSTIRQIFDSEPIECIFAEARMGGSGWDQKCDVGFRGEWKFSNGGIASMYADLAAPSRMGVPRLIVPNARVAHREVSVDDSTTEDGQIHLMTRTVTMINYMAPHVWHRIDIVDKHVIKSVADDKLVKTWTEKEKRKVYTWAESGKGGSGHPGNENWSSYRHMLDQFVNRIKGRAGSGVWIDEEWSVNQMAMMDSGYDKAGLPLRPTSTYR